MNPCRILIVEDEAIVAMDIEERLTGMGYGLAGRAASGEQALALAEQERPDMVLMDVRLQGAMDGITAAEEMRRRFRAPVVFLTAYSEDATLSRATLAEPFGYVLKPFDDRELKSTIEVALYRHRAEEEILRLNRLYNVLSQVNQSIVRTRSRQELFDTVCRLVVERCPADLAWIGWLGEDSVITPVASFGGRVDMLRPVDFSAGDRTHSGKALSEGLPFICDRCDGGGCLCPSELSPAGLGFRSCGAFPLSFRGRVCGVLAVCTREREFFRDRETELLKEVALDISFALDRIEADSERERLNNDLLHQSEALRESEERFRAVVTNGKPIVFMIDKDGKFVLSEGKMLSSLGLSPGEVVGRSAFEMYRDFPPIVKGIETALAGSHWEDTIDVGEASFDIWYTPHFDPNGEVVGLIGMAIDITARKRAEEALADEAIRRRILIEESRDGIVILDEQGKVFEANRRYAEMLGYTAEEVRGLHVWDWDVLSKPAEILEMIRLVDATGDHFETRHRRKDGTLLDVEISTNGAVSGGRKLVFCVCRDISQRKQAEAALRESEERYRTVTEHSLDGIGIIREGLLVYVNRRLCAIFGYNGPEELVGRSPSILIHSDDKERAAGMTRRGAGGDPLSPHNGFKGLTKDGMTLHVELADTLIPYDGGTATLAYYRDVTEQRKLEDLLRQSQKLEAVGQLAGGIAHDFNNILTVISGYGAILRADFREDSPSRAYVDQILASSEKAANLTHGLLAFSRKQTINPKPSDLNESIKRAGKFLSRIISEDIELRTALSRGELVAMVDENQLDQVILNIAMNARDAMPRGGILSMRTGRMVMDESFIRTHGYGKKGSYAFISISDSGVGMDEATKSRVFEPFFTTKEVGKGTGLGLSMVYGIMKQHNGFISVDSDLQKGTTFTIYLPATALRSSDALEETPGVLHGGDETILLVEDEEDVSNYVKLVLETYGYRVLKARDGEDALMQFAESKEAIDLCILDVVMPKMNGKDVYLGLRRLKPEVKVMFMSGYTDDILKQKGLTEGELTVIQKPIKLADFLIKIRETLQQPENK